MIIVFKFLRRIDADTGLKCFCRTISSCCRRLDTFGQAVMQTTNLETFLAAQAETPGALTRHELQGQDTHADQIRAVNTFIALGDNGLDAQQARTFCSPVTR